MKVLISFIPENNLSSEISRKDFEKTYFLEKEYKEELWISHINQFAGQTISQEKIIDQLNYDTRINLWQYNKFRVFNSLQTPFSEITQLKDLLNEEDEFTVISDTLKAGYFPQHSIKVIRQSNVKKIGLIKKSSTYFKYGFVFLIRYLISKKSPKNYPKHLLHGQIKNEITTNSVLDLQEKKINSVWGYLGEKNPSSFSYIEDIQFPSPYEGFQLKGRYFITRNKSTFTNEFILGKGLLNNQVRKKKKEISTDFNSDIDNIIDKLDDSVDIMIALFLKSLSKINSLTILKHLSYDLFFNKAQFLSLTSYGENLSQAKPILDAAKNNAIKTIGLQHGSIGPSNMGYNFSKEELALNPMPDLTLVWGQHWKNLLIELGEYHHDSVVVVGQSRTDIIPLLKNSFNKNTNQIAFFTQPQPDNEERILAATSFISVAQQNPNLEFVIKIHPGEKDDIYSNLITESKANNLSIENRKNTYQILAESSLTLTCYSTVGLESLYFGTPLIIFDSRGRDAVGYIRDKVGHWVKNETELSEVITSFKNNNLNHPEVKDYIESLAYKIDGKVNERIKKVIMNE